VGGPRGARTHNPRIRGRSIAATVASTFDYAHTASPTRPTSRPQSTSFHATNHATPLRIFAVQPVTESTPSAKARGDSIRPPSSSAVDPHQCRGRISSRSAALVGVIYFDVVASDGFVEAMRDTLWFEVAVYVLSALAMLLLPKRAAAPHGEASPERAVTAAS
jgi:hypothetical protein